MYAIFKYYIYFYYFIDLIKIYDVAKEMDKLQTEKALGPPRYRKQVRCIHVKQSCIWTFSLLVDL